MSRQDLEEEVFAQMGDERNINGPKSLVVHFTKTSRMPERRQHVVIQAPSTFPYKNEKAVPWRYGVQVMKGGEQHTGAPTSTIDNIVGIGGMTRSGHIFAPRDLRRGQDHQERQRNEEVISEKTKEFLKEKAVQIEEEPKKIEHKEKKETTDEEASEFLKFIQQSEYKVVDQLNRMPARISLLKLLMHSGTHRKLLMKILSGAHVEQGISLDKFEGIISHITANDHLIFTDEEILAEGKGHNKALHVSVSCMNYFIARVLIDNCSSLNVMPKSTLDKLPFDQTHLRPSAMVVRAFDGSRREVMGEIELPVQIGPCTFQILFQVMDIAPACNCLLRRPWIHSAGVVPSTLHQKLKFTIGDKLVIVSGRRRFIGKRSIVRLLR